MNDFFDIVVAMSKVLKQKQKSYEFADESKMLQLRIHIEGFSPMIWRRILINESDSLGDLHYALQIAFEWDDSHLNHFRIHGRDYGIYQLGGILYRNADEVKLSDFSFRRNEKFLYEYDLNVPWQHIVRVEEILPSKKNSKLSCLGGKGFAPPEDCGGFEGYTALQERFSYGYVTDRLLEMMDNVLHLQELPDKNEYHELRRWYDPSDIKIAEINKKLKEFVKEKTSKKESDHEAHDSTIGSIRRGPRTTD